MLRIRRQGKPRLNANEVRKIRLTLSLTSLPSLTCALHPIPLFTAVPRALTVPLTGPNIIRSIDAVCAGSAKCAR